MKSRMNAITSNFQATGEPSPKDIIGQSEESNAFNGNQRLKSTNLTAASSQNTIAPS